MLADAQTLYSVTDATWPPAARIERGGFTLRRGDGGGQRVSAATVKRPVKADELADAEAAMQDLGQEPLFMIREGEAELDQQLADRGYMIHDPVNLFAIPVDQLTDRPIPRIRMFDIWEPLQIQRDIWAAAGIGAGRWAVMDRAANPKTSILSRWDEQPAGTSYVAIHKSIAMIHAIEILPHQRRKGVAGWMMRHAAFWARAQGATCLSLVTTQANIGANALYASLGMTLVGQYHYRIRRDHS